MFSYIAIIQIDTVTAYRDMVWLRCGLISPRRQINAHTATQMPERPAKQSRTSKNQSEMEMCVCVCVRQAIIEQERMRSSG